MEFPRRVPVEPAGSHARGSSRRVQRSRPAHDRVGHGVDCCLRCSSLSCWRRPKSGGHRQGTPAGAVRESSRRMHRGRPSGWSDCGPPKKRTGPDSGAERDSPDRVIERLRSLWAFATSAHGLGISPERFWCLTTAELALLRKPYESHLERWALERSDFRNVHFRGDSSTPWLPGDFLGTENREERKVEEIESRFVVKRFNEQLQRPFSRELILNIPGLSNPSVFAEIEANQKAIREKAEQRGL